ncbi:776_t:CDS:2, partial [Acaulospora morrowiae]
EVYKQNQNFYSRLIRLSGDKKSAKELGDTLINWVDEMEGPYTKYCLKFQQCLDSLPEVERNIALQQALSDISAEMNIPVSLDFFIDMPMKRIHYYKKLYSRMLNITEPGRSDNNVLLTVNNRIDALIDLEKQARTSIPSEETRVLTDISVRNSSPLKTSMANTSIPRNNQQLELESLGDYENILPEAEKGPHSVTDMIISKIIDEESRHDQNNSIKEQIQQVYPDVDAFTKDWTLSELEKCIDYSRVMDLISKQVKKMSVSLLPPNLPFDRKIILYSDFVMEVPKIQETESSGRAYINAHVFLLTDLLLICQKIEPEAKRENSDLEFYLLYPPLSGRHLTITDISSEGEMVEITLLNRESLILFPTDAETKLIWLKELKKIIEFANNPRRTISVFVRNSRLSRKSSSSGTLSRKSSFREPGNDEHSPSTNDHTVESVDHKILTDANQISPPTEVNPMHDRTIVETQTPLPSKNGSLAHERNLLYDDPKGSRGTSTLLLSTLNRKSSHGNHRDSMETPTPSASNRKKSYSNLKNSRETLTPPLLKTELPALNRKSSFDVHTTNIKNNMLRSHTPEPPQNSGGKYPGDYTPTDIIKDRNNIQERNSDPAITPMRESMFATGARSVVRSIRKFEETVYRLSPSNVDRWVGGIWEPITTKDNCTVEVKITSTNVGCWVIMLHKINQIILNSWIHPGTTIHLDSAMQVSISCDIGQSRQYYRVTCAEPEDAKQLFENLNNVKNLSNGSVTAQGSLSSRSSSLQKSERENTKSAMMNWHPISRLQTNEGAENALPQVSEHKVKIFLQNDHGVWTNFGWGMMSLVIETPQRKRIMVNSNRQKAKLVDAILWEDGVERVGKTNIAITLHNVDTIMRIVYMMQMKDEKTAEKVFELMKAKRIGG